MKLKFQSEEVKDQIEFMFGVYRSAALLYWTVTELQSLRRQQKISDKMVTVTKMLLDTIKIMNLFTEFG